MEKTDAISRSAAMNSLSKVFGIPLDYDGNCDEMCDETFAAIEALPALDVAPVVHARWIMNHFGAKCSNCLRLYCVEPSWPEKIKHMPPTWIYCPNCGARMDGDADAV